MRTTRVSISSFFNIQHINSLIFNHQVLDTWEKGSVVTRGMVTSVLPMNPYAGECTSVPMYALVEVVCHACEFIVLWL